MGGRSLSVSVLFVCIAAAECVASSNESKLILKKCCWVDQILNAVSLSCEDAHWPDASLHLRDSAGLMFSNEILPPYDAQWLSRWVPPGLPLHSLGDRMFGYWKNRRMSKTEIEPRTGWNLFDLAETVNLSVFWNSRNVTVPTPEVLVFDGNSLKRPRLDGGVWSIDDYCVDAALPPMGPYAVLRKCESGECVWKCCSRGYLLASDVKSESRCTEDPRGWWSPRNSSALTRLGVRSHFRVTERFVFKDSRFYIHRNPSDDLLSKEFLTKHIIEDLFSTWLFPCVDFYREVDGSVSEVLGYLYFPRYARAAYKLTRNLSFASVLLLTAALGSIATSSRMRVSAHGRALACHGSCLLLFNMTQAVYYLTISNEVDAVFQLPQHLHWPCQVFGFTAYFMLTAASCWLTALCINMATGFRKNHSVSLRAAKKQFRVMSVLAWGAAALLSAACFAVFLSVPDGTKGINNGEFKVFRSVWYRPSLMETRTCYTEQSRSRFKKMKETDVAFYSAANVKWGTLIFFYGPAAALVLANLVALAMTARRVQYLRRGNALLVSHQEAGFRGGTSDPQGIVVYLKLLLSAGLVETTAELVAWGLTSYKLGACKGCTYNSNYMHSQDHSFVYRAVGYCADFLRAAVVLWLSAPERGALRALWHRLRRKAAPAPGAVAEARSSSTGLSAEAAGSSSFRQRRSTLSDDSGGGPRKAGRKEKN